MSSLQETLFVVVDVETTGADSKENRITDIACVTVLNGQIISEFTSLINPYQSIPPFISKMTGITYDMVINAPDSSEVMNEVKNIFNENENIVFVAHNARFDLSFINQTLVREGMDELSNNVLCTLKLAKRLLPVKQKKNVGALADYYNIHIENRHRALGDALATANFLIELLETVEEDHNIVTIEELLKFQNKQIKHFQAPSLTRNRVDDQLKELPDSPGAYRFLSKNNSILYIGKAKCLKDRVKSYFYNDTFTSQKIAKMFTQIHHIKWECTNTELQALLLESKLIKKHKPPYNTVDKKFKSYPFVRLTVQDEFPIIETCNSIDPDGAEYYGPIRSQALAEEIIRNVEKRFYIRKCKNKFKVSPDNKPCFYFHINQCLSPCSLNISKEDYEKEINKVRLYLSGLPEGIVTQLEMKMHYYSEKLEFEKAESMKRNLAELKRLFSKDDKIPSSINNNNLIAMVPSSQLEKTIDVFLIKSGMLSFQSTIGRKAKLNELSKIIKEQYYDQFVQKRVFTKEDIDEIRIVTSWINRLNGTAKYLYIEGKNQNELLTEFESIIRNISFPEDDQNEYSE